MQVNEVYVGATLYHKGRYGMYRKVEVLSVEGEHAFVKMDDGLNGLLQKVLISKLRKQPSKEFEEMSRKVEKELERAQRELYKFKDGAL